MKIKKILLCTLCSAIISSSSVLMATTIYSDSNLGTYANGGPSSISLSGLSAHTEVTLNFDLYIYDSWDGVGSEWWANDYFGFTVDGTDYSWAFSNFAPNTSRETNPDQTYNTGNYNNINTWGAIDREFINYQDGFSFLHTGSDLTVSFWGQGLQSATDESWSVHNLEIGINANSNPVPEPATMLLFATGLAGLIGLRKRNKK